MFNNKMRAICKNTVTCIAILFMTCFIFSFGVYAASSDELHDDQFDYQRVNGNENSCMTINYNSSSPNVVIPAKYDKYNVVYIEKNTFKYGISVSTVTIKGDPVSYDMFEKNEESYLHFFDCPMLTAIKALPESTRYTSQDGVLFSKDMTVLEQYPPLKPGDFYEVPESVTEIAPYAFSGCTELVDIYVHDNINTIGTHAFDDCSQLMYFSVEEYNDHWRSVLDNSILPPDVSVVSYNDSFSGINDSDYIFDDDEEYVSIPPLNFDVSVPEVVIPEIPDDGITVSIPEFDFPHNTIDSDISEQESEQDSIIPKTRSEETGKSIKRILLSLLLAVDIVGLIVIALIFLFARSSRRKNSIILTERNDNTVSEINEFNNIPSSIDNDTINNIGDCLINLKISNNVINNLESDNTLINDYFQSESKIRPKVNLSKENID